jgi:hypothetical protein
MMTDLRNSGKFCSLNVNCLFTIIKNLVPSIASTKFVVCLQNCTEVSVIKVICILPKLMLAKSVVTKLNQLESAYSNLTGIH